MDRGSSKGGRDERPKREKKMAKAMAEWLAREKAAQSKAWGQERKEEMISRGEEMKKETKKSKDK